MTDFLDLSLARQSCRQFDDRPVEQEKLIRCVEAARLAPSACNSQPWSFIVVREPALVAKVARCTQPLDMNAGMVTAKAFILVLEEYAKLMPKLRCMMDSQYFAAGDLGAAAVCLCLEATSAGLGSCMLGMYDRETLCGLLDIPLDKRIANVIALGYPIDETVRPKIRKPLEDILRVFE